MTEQINAKWTCPDCNNEFLDTVPDPPLGESAETEVQCPKCSASWVAEVTTTTDMQ